MKQITEQEYQTYFDTCSVLSEHSELFFRHHSIYVELTQVGAENRDVIVARICAMTGELDMLWNWPVTDDMQEKGREWWLLESDTDLQGFNAMMAERYSKFEAI